MTRCSHSVDVARPVSLVYEQWSHVERFPMFMDGVLSVVPQAGERARWDVRVAGARRHFDAVVTAVEPGRRIGWRSLDGLDVEGEVDFAAVDDGRTRVTVSLDFRPHGLLESVGDELGLVAHQVRTDLDHFRDFVELIGRPPALPVDVEPEPAAVRPVTEQLQVVVVEPVEPAREESLADFIFSLGTPVRSVEDVHLPDTPSGDDEPGGPGPVSIRRTRR